MGNHDVTIVEVLLNLHMDSTTVGHANMTFAENVQINQKKNRNYVT